MGVKEELKSLKVFSKKLGDNISFFPQGSQLVPAMASASSWVDNGWSNTSDSWLDNGWNNTSEGWMDNGWSNYYSGSWTDNGWTNYYSGSWMDKGWSNSGGGGGGCYITTAAIEFKGLADDCDELNTLRIFRDKLVEEDPEFKAIVLEYYKTAPQIVKKISESPEKEEILESIYNELVEPVVTLLKANQIENAKEHYLMVYESLKEKYLKEPQKILVKN